MYNIPVKKLDEQSAAASLSITGYSFQTRMAPPPMWGGVTGYGTDHIPWWIQREMDKKDRKIKRLEAQVEKQKKEIAQLAMQLSNNVSGYTTDKEVPDMMKETLQNYNEMTMRCTNSINQLDLLMRKVQGLQMDIVSVDTTPSTRFIILKLKELEKLDASD